MFRVISGFALLCLAAGGASGQIPFSFGVKGGVALTDAFEDNTFSYPNRVATISIRDYSPSKDYLVGPFVELRLPFGLGVEADALYRPLHFATASGIPAGTSVSTGVVSYPESSHVWEIPILAKYRLKFPVARPYVDAGPSFRSANGNGQFSASLSNHGFAAGAGVDMKALLLHISPEIRYTRWGADSFPAGTVAPAYSNKNQVELLVGIGF